MLNNKAEFSFAKRSHFRMERPSAIQNSANVKYFEIINMTVNKPKCFRQNLLYGLSIF